MYSRNYNLQTLIRVLEQDSRVVRAEEMTHSQMQVLPIVTVHLFPGINTSNSKICFSKGNATQEKCIGVSGVYKFLKKLRYCFCEDCRATCVAYVFGVPVFEGKAHKDKAEIYWGEYQRKLVKYLNKKEKHA